MHEKSNCTFLEKKEKHFQNVYAEKLMLSVNLISEVVSGVSNVLPTEDKMKELKQQHEKAKKMAEKEAAAKLAPPEGATETDGTSEDGTPDIILEDDEEEDPALSGELTEEDLHSKAPLPYNKLLKRFDLLHNGPIERLYSYLVFYEAIFRYFSVAFK